MAVAQLHIDTEIIRVVTTALLAGLALAFGLGCRELTRNMMAGFYARKVFELGREIEIQGERGELESITLTRTLLRQGDRVVAVANAISLTA